MTRTDIHRPSAPEFDPEAYRCVGVWDLTPDYPNAEESRARVQTVSRLVEEGFRFGGGSGGGCGHCGARIRYAALMVHDESREMLYVGETCLSNRFEALTKAEFDALRKTASLNRERVAKAAKIEALVEAHPLLAWLTYPGVEFSSFVEDVAFRFRQRGELSDRQIEAVERAIVRDTERADARLAREAEAAALRESGVECPEGRVVVEGEIVSSKWVENAYGGSLKMVVKTDAGWKVWGTQPAAIDTADRGARVRFTATIERSKDDALFGFAKRPTQAVIVG